MVHTPDLPLGWTQESAVGLSLWLYPPWAWLLELALLALGGAVLAPVLERAQRRRLGVLLVGLALLQTATEFVVPTPLSFPAFAASALGVYGAVAVAGWWVERVEGPR